MEEAISPVVQVVTTGTDWPAIVAAIMGGLVGISGIVVGYWQSKRATDAASRDLSTRIDAENEHARLAEKRRIYAVCLTAIAEFSAAMLDHRIYRIGGGKESGFVHIAQQRNALLIAVMQARLVGCANVNRLLNETVAAWMDYVSKVDDGKETGDLSTTLGDLRGKVERAMRADLGEPVGPVEE